MHYMFFSCRIKASVVSDALMFMPTHSTIGAFVKTKFPNSFDDRNTC